MSLGRQAKVPFPESYNGFRLIRTHGRVFGIPPALDAEAVLQAGVLFSHPAVLSAPTLDELREQIDRFDGATAKPEVVGQCEGYSMVRVKGALYGVPHDAPPVDLHLPSERRRVGAIPADNPEELEAAIRAARAAAPVEFAGWLPIYEFAGNCGQHPQFTHTGEPPPGYRFTCSAPVPARRQSSWAALGDRLRQGVSRALNGISSLLRVPLAFFRPQPGVSLRARARVFAALVRLFVVLLVRGCRPRAVLRFLQSRHLQSQLLMGDHRGPVFLTSMPFTYGLNPWVIEIEDPTTLFFPLIQNGHTCNLAIAESPYLPIVKAMLEADHCKAILTHMRSTAEMLPNLFKSEVIQRKVVYAPLGVQLPTRWQRHDPQPDDEPIHLLFINSWCQVPENFYVRGGLDVLEAFAILRERYPQLRLTMRTNLPALANHYHRLMDEGWVRVINRFLPAEEMARLHAESHVFLLPAARVHIVSLLQAMSYGLAVVASDGWGMEEYLTHERNGLVVKGRYGKASWADYEAGVLRENYEHMYTPDPQVVAGIVEAVSRLVEDRNLRRRLGRAARQDVQSTYTVAQWNRAIKAALDKAHPVDRKPLSEGTDEAGCGAGKAESMAMSSRR